MKKIAKLFKSTNMSKLGLKIVIPCIFSVVIGITLTVSIILILYTSKYSSLSSDYVRTLTNDYARQIESQMSKTLNTAETTGIAIESIMNQPEAKREEVLLLVHNVLDTHKELVGIGVGFEPNAFDGKDSEYVGTTKHSDENGRFVPYTYRENNMIDYTLLDGYDDPSDYGSWYNVPKRTNKTYVTNPYWYEVGTEKYLMFTCVAPLHDRQGKFIGMTGFDTPVATLNNIVEGAQVFDTGHLCLIAPDGTIAYHPVEEKMGTNIEKSFPAEVSGAINKILSEKTASAVDIEASASGSFVSFFDVSRFTMVPINVGLSGGQWVVLTSVPLSEINKVSRNSILIAVIIGIIIVSVVAINLHKILSSTVLEPVNMIKRATDEMAQGSLNISIPVKSDDELGQLAENVELTSKKILGYVNNISNKLGEISNGNMAVDTDDNYEGDFLPIQTAMKQITEYLNETLHHISNSAVEVSNASNQVAAGAQNLAKASIEQTSSIEEYSGSLDQLYQKTKENAENSKLAQKENEKVETLIAESLQSMSALLNSMNEIGNSSQNVTKIIKVIDDIAFQTNILSLNAAIEAARAGQHGKGFAIVADEVRNLASKSVAAANETAELIKGSLLKVDEGNRLVEQINIRLKQVTETAQESVRLVNEVTVASDKQAKSINEMIYSIGQISAVVQSNSATAKQSAAASEEMAKQSVMLNEIVAKFKLR